MAAPLAPLSPPSSLDHSFRNLTTLFPRPLKPTHFIPKASSSSSDPDPEPQPDPKQPTSSTNEDPFESRLAQVRLRYRSGTGKKAEIRKEKKVKRGSESGSGSAKPGGVLLPPVPLKEPVSGGVKVEFGFSPYSERVNGRLAGLGLVALLLVEVATGKSVINYHTPAIVFIQLYFMAAMCAVFLKYEKEKVSVWPFGDASNSTAANNDV
ncbi:uncharacterized protein LOC141611953 [Silene latifolia]|uniref:uncharacterized protein LOC141611953 n=1 Tax=Silene latifolia TaxID=37657 RepID=UPI003D76FD6E